MPLRTALFLIPAILLAQAPAANTTKAPEPPAEVDQALRARVKDFIQLSTDGNFRKAFEMVAEDSKDFYFGMSKPKFSGYELQTIEYSDNFTNAVVRATVKRAVSFAGQEIQMPLPMVDTWKLESGKWMWAQPQTKMVTTPVGEVAADPAARPGESLSLPKDMSPEAVLAAAKQLQVPTTVDKESLTFTPGVASSQEVTFHNGLNGVVHIIATPILDGGVFQSEPAEINVPEIGRAHV